jgi:membrane-associated HD superfamily phosphohydrolase
MIEYSVLRFNTDTKKVEIANDAFDVKEWKELYSSDKTGTKRYFQNAITLIYFMVYPESPYANHLDQQKLVQIKRDRLPAKVVDKLMKDSKVTDCIEAYKDSVLPLAKRHYEMFKIEVDNFYKDIMKLPSNTEKAEQKYKLMSYADKLMDLEEKLKKRVEKEFKSTSRQTQRKRLFEDRE